MSDKWKKKVSDSLLRVLFLDLHNVRVYDNRLAIWRKDGERLTWEELQHVKQTVWGDRVAVEIFPAQKDVVNLRHTRHLWWCEDIETVVKRHCIHKEFEKEPS